MIKVADRLHNLSDNIENMSKHTKIKYAEETPKLIELAENFADKYMIVNDFQ